MGPAVQERQQYSADYQYKNARSREVLNVVEQRKKTKTLEDYIDHFDSNYQQEGLPKDWYNLNRRGGFSMDMQMQLLKDTSRESTDRWLRQTELDVRGFCLEYLSNKLVYPFMYDQVQKPDGTRELYYTNYEKSMLDGTSEKERNGAVKQSLKEMQDFFLDPNTPTGSVAVITSPLGETGLTTDDGKKITYPDSYFFVVVKDGNSVKGCTIKTDFSLQECRNVIEKLTGVVLPDDASVEDYVMSVAMWKPYENQLQKDQVSIAKDFLQTLQDSRVNRKEYAFKNKKWDGVAKDIQQGEKLYNFNERTQDILDEFKEYVMSHDLSRLELRKGLGATMLLLSKLFLFEDKTVKASYHFDAMRQQDRALTQAQMTFGEVLSRVEELPGCAGGGNREKKKTTFDSTYRVGDVLDETDEDDESFPCPKCGLTITPPFGNACPWNCGLTKENAGEYGIPVC